ncbi:NAD(P)-dependent oxidoreductase [Alkalicoccus luteus]|uniref:NAD(P)-dependent oxidoreductase n=1 Tax=Alkalicoccus luteus TaxID=1237094 RepID=A0A969TVL4_9BACI|nr:NAD(P)-dependent oxidoreductase [Alkalicoccus luteus]NJP38227.1 NAD(P)-dependent oxidoreductase [Alkalicoccus luteus]
MNDVGFIGTGVMGASMAGHLMEAGYTLHLYTRTKAKADTLVKNGAVWHESPADLARHADAVITMVGYPEDVESLYFGEDGLIRQAKQGALLIDMTTSSPVLAERIAAEADAAGLHALDAPVSGGDIGARNAELAIMCGGGARAFTLGEALFRIMGKKIEHFGGAGSGQFTKMANQIAVAGTMLGVAESLAFAEKAGLNTEQVLQTIETGAAGSFSLTKLGRRMIADDMEPGFYIKHFIKDMSIALDAAEEMKLELPGLSLARKLYSQLAEDGRADEGTQALIRWYEGG